jgi:transposase
MKKGETHHSNDLKEKIIAAIKKGERPSYIAKKFGIGRASIYRWKNRKSKTNSTDRLRSPGSGKSPTLSVKQIDKVLGLLAEPASYYGFDSDLWSTTTVRTLIKDRLKVNLHRTTVYRMLTEQNYSSKKPEYRWKEADVAKQELWIKNTIPAIKRYVSRHKAVLYFVDESAISLSASNGRTWGPVGQTTILKRTSKKGRLSVISAISPSNRLYFSVRRNNIKSNDVKIFLKRLMKSHVDRKIVVVLDNASSHHSKIIRDLEKANGNLKIYYLPAYSPEWNPDEKVWNHLKSIELAGHNAKDLDDLEYITRKKMHKIARTPKLLRGIFMRCEVSKFFKKMSHF